MDQQKVMLPERGNGVGFRVARLDKVNARGLLVTMHDDFALGKSLRIPTHKVGCYALGVTGVRFNYVHIYEYSLIPESILVIRHTESLTWMTYSNCCMEIIKVLEGAVMSTGYKKLRHLGSFGDAHAAPSNYLTHKDEPIDEYVVLLAKGSAVDYPDSRNNLFDDSPIEDRRWALMARRFLRHIKHQ